MSKMNRTKFNVCVNLQSCCVLFKVYTCAIWMVCVLSLYVGIASTPLFTGFVYSQITLFKVRSVKRVWRINAHFRPLRVQKAKECHLGRREQNCSPEKPAWPWICAERRIGGWRRPQGRRTPHLDRLESILSNERGGPDFESRGKTMGPQIEERKVRASH